MLHREARGRLTGSSLLALAVLGASAGALICGCASGDSRAGAHQRVTGIRADIREEVLRTALNEYVIDFGARVENTADRIASETDDPRVRRNARLWRLNAIPEMRQACFRPGPYVALFDAWILAAQMHAFFESGAGRDAFGAHQGDALRVSAELLADARALWVGISQDEAQAEEWERTQVGPWVEAHPLADLSFARTSTVARFAELTPERGGALEQTLTLEEQLAVLATQGRIYLTDVHKQVRGEVELVLADLIEPEQVQEIATGLGSLGAAADRAADVAEQMPALVGDERRAILEEIDRQRRLVMDDVRLEREAVVGAITGEREAILTAVTDQRLEIVKVIAAERTAALEAVASERAAALEGISAQRLETLRWLESEIERERAAAFGEFEQVLASALDRADREAEDLVGMVFIRLVGLILVGIVAAPIVAHVYVRVWPRTLRA